MHETNLPDNWKVARLRELGDLVRGVTYKRQETTDTSSSGYLPILRATNIQNRQLLLEELVYVKDEKVSDSQLLRRGDVVIAMSSGSKSVVGKSVQLNTEWNGSFGAFCAVFRHNSTIEPFFIGHIFQTKSYREHLLREARGTNINNLSKNHILDYQFPLPPLPEQCAIAHILQTIQEAKFTRQREITLEHERKAALMDVLFSHGTKGEPRKQTEIGEIPKSWKTIQFGEAVTFTKKPRDLRYSEYNEIPFVPMELIPIAKLSSEEFILKTNDELKSGTYFETGDILLPKITPSFENGKQCIIKELPTPFGIATTEVIPIREVEGVTDIAYLFYYLLLPNVRISLAGKMQGTTGRQRLSKDALVNLQIPLPSLPEQRAVASIFQAIDEKTAALEQEARHLDELFHAMLDELMTGQRPTVPLIDVGLLNSQDCSYKKDRISHEN